MGLDMYAFKTNDKVTTEVDFDVEIANELHYWRKYPNLHGWMERLYRAKGGSTEAFNCAIFVLRASDLDELEKVIKTGRLPPTSGFFSGESDGSETDDDLAFIAKAREAIRTGSTVFYTSWW